MKNKVNENKVLYCKAIRCETIKNNEGIKMWNNKKQPKSCFLLCQTYKPTIILT